MTTAEKPVAGSDDGSLASAANKPGGLDSPKKDGGMKSYARIFAYTDRFGWLLNVLALIGTVGAGSALPLMDLILGKMITTFNNQATGADSPSKFRSELNRFTYVLRWVVQDTL